MLFVRVFDLRLFGFVCFLFLLVFGRAAASVALSGLFSYLFYIAFRSNPFKPSGLLYPYKTEHVHLSSKIVLDGQASDLVPLLSGVPHGSVLGPILFLVFIKDLPDNIGSSVRLFADECVLFRNISSVERKTMVTQTYF